MTKKKDLEALKYGLKKVEGLKVEIAKKRDELREAVEEIEDILSSLDDAVDGLEDGARNFKDAVDKMSEYL